MHRASPTQLHKHVSQLLTGGIIKTLPVWYSAMNKFPPGQSLLRSPLQFREKDLSRKKLPNKKAPSPKHLKTKIPRPQKIRYMEDSLRREFYREHPYELLRPQIMMEKNDGIMEGHGELLSKLKFPCRVTGEDVIRYQTHLMKVQKLGKHQAYVEACNEFYKIRAREEVAERVAEEQALLFGAKISRSQTERSLWLEHENLQMSEPQVINQVLRIMS
ncbi:18743_t:CDS:2 [Funneliformis geosporum]|uniref:Small ribosomal subunit protein mS23 n=1 Tax=Funneliformis geosporum TaxID=1117311 RepID=A0A9W4SM12_9GLOM|nr:18743_t:CDS:2 [Funneliformis geosporum]CAI2171898.1 5581_t:CDS:2 [Funneliformis geosporum]